MTSHPDSTRVRPAKLRETRKGDRMQRINALMLVLALAIVGWARAADDAARPTPVAVTGKVVALKNLGGQLTAVKLLGRDGIIYNITLDDTGKALAGQAKRIVLVKGTAVEKQPAGERPAVWQLTVEKYESDELTPEKRVN